MQDKPKFIPAETAFAHCDIPCGIYDPHLAQVAAHTVFRMATLVSEHKDDAHAVSRYAATKEEHAEIVKHEVRVIWGDYFKDDQIKQVPDIHSKVHKIMQLASKARQSDHVEDASALIDAVNDFAVAFWKTKGKETISVTAPYPTAKPFVVPKLE